jgi:AraC-like DNA-binding protein
MKGMLEINPNLQSINKVIYSSLKDMDIKLLHKGVSLKYVVKGCEKYEINNKQYQVNAGEFLIVNHNSDVRCTIKDYKSVDGVCIYLDESLIKEVINENDEDKNYFLKEGKFDSHTFGLGNFLKQIQLPTQKNTELFRKKDIYYKIGEYLKMHFVEVENKINNISSKKRYVREDLFNKLNVALEYINDNIDDKLQINEIAKQCGMSEYHFFRTFKQAYGISPYNYIMDRRLEKAYEMITVNNVSIGVAAIECGFNDLSHFTRYFKKKYKYLPSKARKYYLLK